MTDGKNMKFGELISWKLRYLEGKFKNWRESLPFVHKHTVICGKLGLFEFASQEIIFPVLVGMMVTHDEQSNTFNTHRGKRSFLSATTWPNVSPKRLRRLCIVVRYKINSKKVPSLDGATLAKL